MYRFLAPFLLICVSLAAGSRPAWCASGDPPSVRAHWTDAPPALDGRGEDACWQSAEAAGDLARTGGGIPSQKTEVRFAYDGRALYVLWKAFESRMESVLLGKPEPPRDAVNREESAELYIYPRPGDKEFLLLAASPLGARFDLSSKAWTDFNPDWQCAAGRFEGGWLLEARIPFGELAEEGRLMATPRAGEQWGLQLYRKKADPREVNQWTTSPSGGRLLFAGRPAGPALPEVSVPTPELRVLGPTAFELCVSGAAAPVQASFVLLRDSRPITAAPPGSVPSPAKPLAGAAGRQSRDESAAPLAGSSGAAGQSKIENRKSKITYRLDQPGAYRLRFALSSAGKTFFTGQAAVSLPPVAGLLRTLDTEMRAAEKVLAGGRHPEFARIRERVAAFRRGGGLPGQRALTAKEFGEQVQGWMALRRDVALARLYPGRPAAFTVGTATESDKVYPDSLPTGSPAAPIEVSGAGGEYASFQVVVAPFWQDLAGVSLAFTPLKGPAGRSLPADQFRWFRVAYVKLEDPPAWARVRYEHSREPDPLLPAAPFAVAKGTAAPAWVDLLIARGTPAGVYTGAVTVSANGQQVRRPIRVLVHGFDLPERGSIEANFWFNPVSNWNAFYLNKGKTVGIYPYAPEVHARHAEVLGRYRVSSFLQDWTFLCPRVPIFREPDGRFTFDWTLFDRYAQNAIRNGSTAFWCALSCNSGWTAYLNSPDVPVTDRATGKRLKLGDLIPEGCGDFYGSKQYQNPVYRDFLTAYVAHLKELGILETSYYELFDEAPQDPPPHRRWVAMTEHHRFFRQVAPGLRLLNFGIEPTQVIEGKSALGLIDVWAPHLFQLDATAYPGFAPNPAYPVDEAALKAHPFGRIHQAIIERRREHGERYWTYTCTERTDAKGNYTPFCLYHRPYLSLRIHSWMAWRMQWDGFLIYALSGVPKSNLKEPEQRWPLTEWSEGGDMGCGTLVYPGPDFELIPGMRLANAREGLEDYEYFALLRREAARLDPARHAALLARVNRALRVEAEIVSTVYVWTKERARLEAKRRQLAALIAEVRATLPVRR